MSRETGSGPGPGEGTGVPQEPQGDSAIGRLRKKYRLLPPTPDAGPRNPFDDEEGKPAELPEDVDLVPEIAGWSEPKAEEGKKKRRFPFGRRRKEENPLADPSALSELAQREKEDQEAERAEGSEGEERGSEEGEAEPLTLADRRLAYARALKSRGRLIGRISEQDLDLVRSSYIQELEKTILDELASIRTEYQDRDLQIPEIKTELAEKLADLILRDKSEEENALREAMKDGPEKAAGRKFKEFWRKHTKVRVAVGFALTGATMASAATGNPLAAGMFLGAKSALSGVSTTMATEGLLELGFGKYGMTRERTKEEIDAMSYDQLERALAAHTMENVDAGGEFGAVKRRGVFRKHDDETTRMLQEAYERKRREWHASHIRDSFRSSNAEGRTQDEIVAHAIEVSLRDLREGDRSLEDEQTFRRKQKIFKWGIAGATGLLAGSVTHMMGAARAAAELAHHGKEGGEAAATSAAEHAHEAASDASGSANGIEGGQMAEQASGAAAEQSPADSSKSLIDEMMAKYNGEHAPAAGDSVAQAEHLGHAATAADTAHTGGEHLAQAPDAVHGADAGQHFPSAVEKFPGIADPDKVSDAANPASQWFDQGHAHTPSTFEEFTSEHPVVAGAAPDAAAHTAQAAEAAKVDPVEVVKKGDSVWKLAKHQLEARFGQEFTGLDEARQTYVIDSIKDRIAEHPSDFGLHDADTIAVGEKIDFSPIFGDQHIDAVKSTFSEAQNLNETAVQNILHNNAALDHWVAAHPAEHLTSAKVEEILHPVAASASDLGIHRDALGIAKGVTSGMTEVAASHDASWAADVQCRLAEQVVAQHHPDWSQAEISSAADQVREAVSGGAEAGHGPAIELTSKGAKAVQGLRKATDALFASAPKESADKMLHAVTQLDADTAMHKGVIEKTLDRMQDGTSDMGKNIGKSVRKVLEALPKGSIKAHETVGDVFARVREVR